MPWLTVCSLFLSAFVFWTAPALKEGMEAKFLLLTTMVGACSLLGSLLFFGSILGPLTKVEMFIGPAFLLRASWGFRALRNWLLFFPWFSFLLPIMVGFGLIPVFFPFLVWTVAFGVYLDVLRWGWRWVEELLNPQTLVRQLQYRAKWAIQNERDDLLWSSLDGMGEVALKAAQQHNIFLCSHAIDSFAPIVSVFFASSKSISRKPIDEEVKQETGRDEASYTLFYLLQRLQLIHQKAISLSMEALSIHLIRVLGKIALSCIQFDFSLVAPPLRFLSRFGVQAEKAGWEDTSRLVVSTLLELAKQLVVGFDVRLSGLQEPLFALIQGLDDISRATFQRDRQTPISLILSPFLSLKDLLHQERLEGYAEMPTIQAKLDTVITQFQTLEQLLQRSTATP